MGRALIEQVCQHMRIIRYGVDYAVDIRHFLDGNQMANLFKRQVLLMTRLAVVNLRYHV